jgi:hypothetical protein
VTNLVELSYFVLSEMKDGGQVDAVYTDFSMAFDKELLSTLTRRLRCLKIFWNGSYLTGRRQRPASRPRIQASDY